MIESNVIGNKIKQVRERQEMSVEELAVSSQTSVELIDQLESGALIPSLTPLLKIARSLGVRLGTFLDDIPQTGPVVVRSGQSENIIRFSGNTPESRNSTLDFFSLGSNKQDRHMEPFVIDVHPSNSKECKLSSHEGEEFIYILTGNIEVCYGKEKYSLTSGDSIYYDSIVPHYVYASGNDDAKILAVVYTPA
ncbi:MAG: cupin domain-containing protein [Methanosarcinaceae archaeon]|nr:cupin domain-containing protein [Methanosarcinaceae archaeon]